MKFLLAFLLLVGCSIGGEEPICETNGDCPYRSRCILGECISSVDAGRNDTLGDVCEFDHQCNEGQKCVSARCALCGEDICDGLDNDCDGIVDNNSASPLSRYCSITQGFSQCEGISYCFHSNWTECLLSQSIPEIGGLLCDGLDNDCDGCVDGRLDENQICVSIKNQPLDVLFLIDISGSMGQYIDTVRAAISIISTNLSLDENRFGIVLFPYMRDMHGGLYLPISNFESFQDALDMVYVRTLGREPSLDVVFETGYAIIDPNWRSVSARILILFTDEAAQSYRFPSVTESNMCSSLIRGEQLFVITLPEFFGGYDECASSLISLSLTPEEVATSLSVAIVDPCL